MVPSPSVWFEAHDQFHTKLHFQGRNIDENNRNLSINYKTNQTNCDDWLKVCASQCFIYYCIF